MCQLRKWVFKRQKIVTFFVCLFFCPRILEYWHVVGWYLWLDMFFLITCPPESAAFFFLKIGLYHKIWYIQNDRLEGLSGVQWEWLPAEGVSCGPCSSLKNKEKITWATGTNSGRGTNRMERIWVGSQCFLSCTAKWPVVANMGIHQQPWTKILKLYRHTKVHISLTGAVSSGG